MIFFNLSLATNFSASRIFFSLSIYPLSFNILTISLSKILFYTLLIAFENPFIPSPEPYDDLISTPKSLILNLLIGKFCVDLWPKFLLYDASFLEDLLRLYGV